MQEISDKALGVVLRGRLVPATCDTCRREYFVYSKTDNPKIEKCCVCRHGKKVVESFNTKKRSQN